MWNTCVIDVAWNKPPNKPIPLFKYVTYRLSIASKKEYNEIKVASREKSMDLSRLKVTALDNNKNKIDVINIVICLVLIIRGLTLALGEKTVWKIAHIIA